MADEENNQEQQAQKLSSSDDQIIVRTEFIDLALPEEEKTLPQTEELSNCPGCQSVGVLTLPCSHKLCLSCIELSRQEMGQDGCTICHGSQLMDSVLQSLFGALFQGEPRRAGVTPQAEAMTFRGVAEETKPYGFEKEKLCVQHGELFSEFCLEDEELLCQKCHMDNHGQHQCCSIQEAVLVCKSQSVTGTQVLRQEFEKMHQYLHDEEATLMSQLNQDEEVKVQRVEDKINKISNDIRMLTTSMRDMENVMESEDIIFLENYRSALKRTPYRAEESQDEFGTLLDVPKYQSCIQYYVWEKMPIIIQYFPVTLDPNTGSTCLGVSPDLSSVFVCDEKPLPDNPERFVNPKGILGSAGFSSGSHHWEVEVGDNSQWSLGVANETVKRKDSLRLDENPEESGDGLWTVSLFSGEYYASPGQSAPLTLRRRPYRVRIQLDWERGCLTFSDVNGNTLIYRFKKQWTGTLRPYFSTTCSKHPLKITEASVTIATE
ncbi:zinc-binding protein A33-like isoform X2 [Phyllopteryx taeniolatus]|uniref:zinc-binding protein A33-like isoform X2 n=1 Tax=Phyllopteryx taeniolatus TaxID=161469 RepID=UPI002AD212C3|nr:zinc-binding protein A33-like isoform X2 [Phyllopteryx taeniolatus]